MLFLKEEGTCFCWPFIFVWVFFFSPCFSFAQQKHVVVQVQWKCVPGSKEKVGFCLGFCLFVWGFLAFACFFCFVAFVFVCLGFFCVGLFFCLFILLLLGMGCFWWGFFLPFFSLVRFFWVL